jgi:hypothetical protein
MSDPRDILCKLIAEHGRELCEDAARCEAFLRDYCPHDRGKVHVLVAAVEERVVADLLICNVVIPVEMQMARLVKRMEDHLAIREDMARWAVESWALAFGIIKLPNHVTSESNFLARIGRAGGKPTPEQVIMLEAVAADFTEWVARNPGVWRL